MVVEVGMIGVVFSKLAMKPEGEKTDAGEVSRRLEAAKREQRNPLLVHARSFAASLMDDGYAAATMQSKLGLIVDLGQWLGRRGFAVTDLDERRIETFIAGRRRNGLCRRGDRTTASPFVNTTLSSVWH
jgi:hypothetical protein